MNAESSLHSVIPAQAGIHASAPNRMIVAPLFASMGPALRRDDAREIYGGSGKGMSDEFDLRRVVPAQAGIHASDPNRTYGTPLCASMGPALRRDDAGGNLNRRSE
jgi:hypothetical protein